MTDRHKIDGLRIATKGFMAFNKYGDVWMGGSDIERLQGFIKLHPWLKLEPEIYTVSSKTGDISIEKPTYLREKHAQALGVIPAPTVIKRGPQRGLKAALEARTEDRTD